MLAVPLSLTLAAALNFCTNLYLDSIMRFETVAAARFGALADVTIVEANEHAASVCRASSNWAKASCAVEIDSSAKWSVATFSYQPLSIIFFQSNRITIIANVAREI